MTRSLLHGRRVAITGGTSGLGLALVRELNRRGAAVAFVARTADRVHAVAAGVDGTCGIVGDVSRKDDVYPIAMQITAALGGLDVLVNNASSLGPFRWRRSRGHRLRGFRGGAGHECRRAVPADEGAARRAGRVRTRRAGAVDHQHLDDAAEQRPTRLGRLRREQGGAPPPHAHLARRTGRSRHRRRRGRSRRHGYADARARGARRRSRRAEAAADAAVEIAELIEACVRATAGARERAAGEAVSP